MFHTFFDHKYHGIVKEYVLHQTDYEVQEILGFGSYGVAYLLVHKKDGQKVVLKRLRSKHRRKTKIKQKFQQEITMLEKLNSSHVPGVIAEGHVGKLPFYMMEFIDGHTFEHVIFQQNKHFTLLEALEITKQLLQIVMGFHAQGIVHRDLRIPNILLKDGTLQIIDFGLAAYIKNDSLIEHMPNPKKAENHCSDLYYVGHFLLYLLYSNYTPINKKERSWQEELQLPTEVVYFIERLLLLQPAFTSAEEARKEVPHVK